MTPTENLAQPMETVEQTVPYPVDPLSDLFHYLKYTRDSGSAKVRLMHFTQLAIANTKRIVDDCERRADFYKVRLRPWAENELANQAGKTKTVKTPLGAKLAFRTLKPALVECDHKEIIEVANERNVIDELVELGVLTIKYNVSLTGLRAAIENKSLPEGCEDLAYIEEEAPPDSMAISFDDPIGFLELAEASAIRDDDSHLVYHAPQETLVPSSITGGMAEG